MNLYNGLLGLALLFIALTAAPWGNARASLVCLIAACVCAVLMSLIGFGVIHP